ncbi:MAG: hypothetical protein AAF487_10425 [Bacteroidota bacterium]
MMSKKKYIPKEKASLSKEDIEKKKNFQEVLNKVKDELKGNLAMI